MLNQSTDLSTIVCKLNQYYCSPHGTYLHETFYTKLLLIDFVYRKNLSLELFPHNCTISTNAYTHKYVRYNRKVQACIHTYTCVCVYTRIYSCTYYTHKYTECIYVEYSVCVKRGCDWLSPGDNGVSPMGAGRVFRLPGAPGTPVPLSVCLQLPRFNVLRPCLFTSFNNGPGELCNWEYTYLSITIHLYIYTYMSESLLHLIIHTLARSIVIIKKLNTLSRKQGACFHRI